MSSEADLEKAIRDATKTCTTNQSMIVFTSKHLDELRTQCASTDKITQIEIKDAESKLIRMVGNQLVAKQKLNVDNVPEALKEYPKLELWLRIVGIPESAIKEILDEGLMFSDLLNMERDQLTLLLQRLNCSELEIRTLLTAFKNLRACTEKQLLGQSTSEHDWHFTDLACLQAAAVAATAASRSTTSSPAAGNSPKHQGGRISSSTSSATSLSSVETSSTLKTDVAAPPGSGQGGKPLQPASTSATPAPSILSNSIAEMPPPRSTPSSPVPSPHTYNGSPPASRSKSVSSAAVKYPITPPPKKGYMLFPESSITKSKSHESQLANKVVDIDPVKSNKRKPQGMNIKLSGSHEVLFRRRLSTDGSETGSRGPSGHTSPVISSPIRSPPYKHDPSAGQIDDHSKYSNTLTVPKSPKTPLKLHHQIYHRFANTFKITTCDHCHKQMILGYKCKDCKKKFHKDCAQRAPPTCGLSDATVDALLEWNESPMSQRRMTKGILSPSSWEESLKPVKSMPAFPGGPLPDSGSNTSSCNSSSPSSPAYHQTSSDTITSPSPAPSPYSSSRTQFNFPDVASTLPADFGGGTTGTDSPDTDVVSTDASNDSDKTLIDSNTSERTLPDRVDSVDSTDDYSWNRQNSLAATMKEWDIPYEDLNVGDAIGKGRIGTVYRGQWHGDVAIKLLDTGNSTDNEAQLAAFKLEIAILRKTRHENLVLFMGACMKPPRLAIVTSFCKGQTLYTMIHLNKNTFKINKAIIIASQIAQGMSYLHARAIIHKDLRTKNIFMDSGKVVITDFGLFHMTKLCRGTKSQCVSNEKDNWLSVPKGWLCYLAPEIIRSLQAMQQSDLPFTKMSDLYAFGTVWYELLCNEWPFRSQPCETVIWQVGKGIKQSLSTVSAPREVKEILMSCWSFRSNDRPDFAQIAKALDRIPRTRLIRSPSHPCQLSRSSEAISLS
ncbi:kinase suppressor of Ras 2 isoform X2 [Aplysia californica]|uniref:Kinase suppressor of Ras 2 isoform X2 n=1 Tax=Aplysia californica TaxID=6500 RepID=A0ABM0JVR8_APLCA|nr:kinase suppressor of Ras 2 isoform X2 [Aplysia californica]